MRRFCIFGIIIICALSVIGIFQKKEPKPAINPTGSIAESTKSKMIPPTVLERASIKPNVLKTPNQTNTGESEQKNKPIEPFTPNDIKREGEIVMDDWRAYKDGFYNHLALTAEQYERVEIVRATFTAKFEKLAA